MKCQRASLVPLPSYEHSFFTVVPKARSRRTGKRFERRSSARPNVFVIGLDSMSRSNFIRQLPLTYAELQRQGFVDFKKHVKVADNTLPNWMAFLAGKHGTTNEVSICNL